MKIITLLENGSCDSMLGSAHGLSLYIETSKHKILFDMGPDEQFLSNAEKLGVDLKAVDLAILSHGHYDHGGGLKAFCQLNDTAKICLRKGSFGDYVALEEDGSLRYIGLDPTLQAYADRLVFTEEQAQLDEELLLFSDVPDTYGALSASAKLKERQGANLLQDRFLHEQDLLITAEGKTVLVSGCSHRGIVNILRSARALGGGDPNIMIGGFHLFQLEAGDPAADRLIEMIGKALLAGKTEYYTGHCTGDYAYERLASVLNGRLHRIMGGTELEF
jgi:7,8-dihydropterin-6-yl-methyl-4-(beta-D-ribofuranosyl)aminobenzene 5'-phosphate synthase